MLRELMEANHDGHNKALSDEHLETIFDAVAHDELDMDRIKEMASELGHGDDYDRTSGGAYFAMMRMYICVHGEPPEGKIVGNWWKQVPPGFVKFAEDNGIHNAHENVIRATGVVEHKLHKQKEEKGAAKAAKDQAALDAKKAKADEKARKAHGKNVLVAQKTFQDRWPTIRATISPQSIRKEVEAAKSEIFHDMATGKSIHAAIAKVVTQHGGIMEAQKFTFRDFLIEGVVDASARFAAKKEDDTAKKDQAKTDAKRKAKKEADDAKYSKLRADKEAKDRAAAKRRGVEYKPKTISTKVGPDAPAAKPRPRPTGRPTLKSVK